MLEKIDEHGDGKQFLYERNKTVLETEQQTEKIKW